MRKIILVSAMVLASASAQASGSRGLVLASADDAAVAPAPQATQAAPPADAPKYVDRPAAVSATAPAAAATAPPAPPAAKPVTAKADRPKRKPYWTEGRIIGELHRHGIYW